MEDLYLTIKKELGEELHCALEELKTLKKGSDEYGKLVKDIQNISQAYLELEKNEFNVKDAEQKFAESIRQKEVELYYKDSLERDRLKSEKSSDIRNMIVNMIKIVLIGGGSIALGILALKLEFVDQGAVCSFSAKELLKKASTIMKSV